MVEFVIRSSTTTLKKLPSEEVIKMITYLEDIYTNENSTVGILLEFCTFFCTYNFPKNLLVSVALGLVDIIAGFNLHQACVANEQDHCGNDSKLIYKEI